METDHLSTSLTLLDRLRQPGGADAWGRFVLLYTPILQDWAKRHGFQPADAADLVQEVLVKLIGELPRYVRGEGQSFRGWLYRVTANQGRDFRRRAATRALPGAAGLSIVESEGAFEEFEEVEYRRTIVNRALELVRGEFTDRTWAAFSGLMINGRPAADLAREFGTTENAVYLARHRVLTRLRREIEGLLD